MPGAKCRICRRVGVKLFLKGERCLSPKCAIIKKPYSPGQKPKRRTRNISEYAKELREKQKMRNWYNLKEKQFKKYVKEVLDKPGKAEDAGELLIRGLATRLDNVIFRLGFASSRAQAKQLANHNHFLVNGKRVNIPSFQVKKGDVISLSEASRKKPIFKNIQIILKKTKAPAWIELNPEKLEGKIISMPTLAEAAPPAEIHSVFEYYSR